MQHPLDRLTLRLDHQTARLENALQHILMHRERRLESAALTLARHSPAHRLQLIEQRLRTAQERLVQGMRQTVQDRWDRFSRAAGILHAVSPLATLARGYAIVRTTGRQPRLISSSTQVRQGDRIEATLHQGSLLCQVEQIRDKDEEMEG